MPSSSHPWVFLQAGASADNVLPKPLPWEFMAAPGSALLCILTGPVTRLGGPSESEDLRFHVAEKAEVDELALVRTIPGANLY